MQKIKIRGLFTTVGIVCPPNEELAQAPALIVALKNLAQAAGGPAPQPAMPNVDAISALENQSGNGLLLELFTRCGELTTLVGAWKGMAEAIQRRLPAWTQLAMLIRHAQELEPYATLQAEIQAILDQRSLLADPDPVRPVLDRTADRLRLALNAHLTAYTEEYAAQMAGLATDAHWQALDAEQQDRLIGDQHIEPSPSLDLSTAEKLGAALNDCDLRRWIERTHALRNRFDAVRLEAARLLKPDVVRVHLPKRTLNTAEEVKAWVLDVERVLLDRLQSGPVMPD